MMLTPAGKIFLAFLAAALLQACASGPKVPRSNYDLGALPQVGIQSAVKLRFSLADVSAPETLDSNAMLYRLQYDNEQQVRPYASYRWTMPPAQLLTQRIKSRMAAAGVTIVSVAEGVADLPVLKIDLDEFDQLFTGVSHSHAQISFRASVIKKNKLLAQRYFTLATKADAADAPGGAKAMQIGVDNAITELTLWLIDVPAN